MASKFTLPRKKEKQGIQGNPPLVCMKLPRNINEREKFWAFELVVLQSSIIMYGGIINLLCAKQGSDLLYRHSLSFLLCWKKQANKKRQKQKKTKNRTPSISSRTRLLRRTDCHQSNLSVLLAPVPNGHRNGLLAMPTS